jgi:hypothetical protein
VSTTATIKAPRLTNAPKIVRALNAIRRTPGQVTELRALEATGPGEARFIQTWSGYYDDPEKLAADLATLHSFKGAYTIPNPVNSALLARSVNRIRPARKEPLTQDGDVIRRHWLYVDCDPVRPSGISASDNEYTAATERAAVIRADLYEQDWPRPIVADSGNGGHLMFAVDLPVDDNGLVKRCLEALAATYDDHAVRIDQTVHNPARLWRVYGALNGKGDDAGEECGRPHRMARMLEAPDELETVSRELLENLAARAPSGKSTAVVKSRNANGQLHQNASRAFNIEDFVRSNGLDVLGPEPWSGRGGVGRKWVFRVCPWNPDHVNRSAYILQHASGAVDAGCHHESCKGKTWHDLRRTYEPGFDPHRRQEAAPSRNGNGQHDGERPGEVRHALDDILPPEQRYTDPTATPPEPQVHVPKSVRELVNEFPALREPIIHGLMRKGETVNIIAASKVGKSWLVTDLAIAIATGRMWLGTFQTQQGNVLILDNELHGETSANRIPKVAAARGITLDEYADHLHVENLRGQLRDVFNLGSYFASLPRGYFKVVIIDAFYRAMPPDMDENDNGTMAAVYNQLDLYADLYGLSYVLIHHASKGNQSGKAVTDVGSGAGSQARATDTHLVLRPHEEAGAVVMDAAVRSWPPHVPVCLRWQFPFWQPDPHLDPTKLLQPGNRRRREGEDTAEASAIVWTIDLFVERFIDKAGKTKDEIMVDAKAAGLSGRDAQQFLGAAVAKRKAFKWLMGRAVKEKYSKEEAPLLIEGSKPPKSSSRK